MQVRREGVGVEEWGRPGLGVLVTQARCRADLQVAGSNPCVVFGNTCSGLEGSIPKKQI